jgi:hypothetical protein|tara:strand:- start:470 stop:613 length:144 start_codon:yes stop_codon:yes gene_type:complete
VSFWDNLFWGEFKIYHWLKNKYWDWKLKRKIDKKLKKLKSKDPFIYK